ncbi:DNA pilot protein [Microvirus mar39]|uniref:DNA pilot protein n=1 Tax=Microvirus mar39 TaxID=2851173 RepID=A0A8F5RC20_9VIRU|nr:DNA pilot protein [Microvirus mar39]
MAWGAIAGLAGGIIGNAMNNSSAKKTQERQERFTREQMQNAHQWEVEDLKKAGLNPVLSANSAHAIGGASGTTPQIDLPGAMQAGAQAENLTSGKKLNEKLGDQAEANAGLAIAKTKGLPQQIKNETITAKATQQMAEARTKEVDANVERVKKLLPGELQGQTYDLAIKAYENKLTQREKKVLDNTGLTLSEWKALGGQVVDVAKEGIRMKVGAETAKRIAETRKTKNH